MKTSCIYVNVHSQMISTISVYDILKLDRDCHFGVIAVIISIFLVRDRKYPLRICQVKVLMVKIYKEYSRML